MTSPELLRFFHAEAREYLDTIEQLVGADAGFDAAAFLAASRALRGSATMARVPRIAEIALTMERAANAVRDGEMDWSPELRDELELTLDDLRGLVVATGNWTGDDDRRALRRLARLRGQLPDSHTALSTPAGSGGSIQIFIALQVSAIASDIGRFLDDPANRSLVDDVLKRVRSLRGIAGVADHPPLGDVADTVERVLRELAPDAFLRSADVDVLGSAAEVFRRASADLRTRGRFDRTASEVETFARAVVAAEAGSSTEASPVVRIEELFYTDAGPHLVRRGAAPLRSADARFREDVIARAEHLRRLVAEARVAMDPFSRERVRRDLKGHLARTDEFARSYGAQQVAAVMAEAAALDDFPESVLDTIDHVARVLSMPGISTDEMERRLAIGERQRHEAPTPTAAAAWAPAAAEPSGSAATSGSIRPTGEALHNLLGDSLRGLASLEAEPLAEPATLDEATIVPVETLLYRGQAALERAREVRDAMRARGGTDEDALSELYDLLDLARTQ